MRIEEMKNRLREQVGDHHFSFEHEWNHYASGREENRYGIYVSDLGWFYGGTYHQAFREVVRALKRVQGGDAAS